MMIDGWLLFLGEAPMVGLDPMPAFAPQSDNPTPDNSAQDWFSFYTAHDTFSAAMEDVRDFWQIGEDDEDGEDVPDFPLPVRVHDDGRMEIFDTDRSSLLATYTSDDIFEAFGLTFPEKDT